MTISSEVSAFPFPQLPELLQLRFLQLCNHQMFITMLLEMPHLCKLVKRKIRRKITISDIHKSYNEIVLQSFGDFDKTTEVYDCFEIYLLNTPINEADVLGIKVVYNELICHIKEMDIELFKHLLSQSVKKCNIDFYIPSQKVTTKFKVDFANLMELLIPVFQVRLKIRSNHYFGNWIYESINRYKDLHQKHHQKSSNTYFNVEVIDREFGAIVCQGFLLTFGPITLMIVVVVFIFWVVLDDSQSEAFNATNASSILI